jgi:hypothetical protein
MSKEPPDRKTEQNITAGVSVRKFWRRAVQPSHEARFLWAKRYERNACFSHGELHFAIWLNDDCQRRGMSGARIPIWSVNPPAAAQRV